MKRLFSLKNKIIVFIVFTILFFGVLAVFSIMYVSQNNLVKLEKEGLLTSTVIQSHKMKQAFENAGNLVSSLASSSPVIGFLEKGREYDEADKNFLLDFFNAFNKNNKYSSIYLMDKEGNTLVSTDRNFEGKNYSFRPYFKDAMTGKSHVSVAIGVTSKQPGYYFSHPIRIENEQIIGVMVTKMIPDAVHKLLVDSLQKRNNLMLVDEYGVVIYSTKQEFIYKSMGQLSEESKRIIEERKIYSGIDIEAIDYQPLQDYLDNHYSGAISVELFDEHDNKLEILSMAKVDKYPFYVITEANEQQILEFANNIAFSLSFFVAMLAFIAAVVIFILLTNFFKPVAQLQEMALKISAGSFDHQLNIKTGDELEDLAVAMTTMTQKLKASYQNLNQQVEEKTTELSSKLDDLEKMNKLMAGRELKMIELKQRIKKLCPTAKINNGT